MTRLAIRGNPGFRVSTLELTRDGPSYTADTVRALASRAGGARCYLLIGADSLDDFKSWERPDEILSLATLAVAGRPGAGARGRRAWPDASRITWLENPEIDLSSSDLRARVRAGNSIKYLVPDPVAAYIAKQKLYRSRRAAASR